MTRMKANETHIQATGTISVSTCRPAYCFRRMRKNVPGTKVLGNAVSERTTNFCWTAVQQVRDLCFYFLSSSFLLLPIFSLFSNNTTRYDLPNRQSIISSVQSSPCQSSPAQPSQDQPPAQQASQKRFGNIKIHFINKGIEFIDLPSIFMDRSVTSSIPAYFQNSEPRIICYKYNKPIRKSKKISNDQELIQSDPTSCPQNQKGNN